MQVVVGLVEIQTEGQIPTALAAQVAVVMGQRLALVQME